MRSARLLIAVALIAFVLITVALIAVALIAFVLIDSPMRGPHPTTQPQTARS